MSNYISLCVLSYNRPQLLAQVLNSIKQNTVGPYELIVNDDCSNEQVSEFLYGLYRRGQISTLILNAGGNQGVGKAIKNMFDIASGKYFVKIDQDLVFSHAWDTRVCQIMDIFPEVGALGLFKYYLDPVDFPKMYLRTMVRGNISIEVVQDFVGSAIVTRPELYKSLGFVTHSDAFAEDIVFKKAIQAKEFLLALPTGDLAENKGFGPGPSTVVYREGEEIKVTTIHKEPLTFNRS